MQYSRTRLFAILSFILSSFFLVLAYSVLVEPYNIHMTEHHLDFFGSPGQTVKAVLISDTQLAYDYPDYFARVISEVNRQEPDVIFISGDIVDGEPGGWTKLGLLSGLRARYGVYAVLGNHDYQDWKCGSAANDEYASHVAQTLESFGVRVLRNEQLTATMKGRSFTIIGLDDLWACKADPDKASSGVDPALPKIILVHNNLAVSGMDLGNRSLVLSGHTHCGQVDVPFVTDYLVEALGFGKITGGEKRLPGGATVFVTCGVTPGGIRLFSRPEISVLYLD